MWFDLLASVPWQVSPSYLVVVFLHILSSSLDFLYPSGLCEGRKYLFGIVSYVQLSTTLRSHNLFLSIKSHILNSNVMWYWLEVSINPLHLNILVPYFGFSNGGTHGTSNIWGFPSPPTNGDISKLGYFHAMTTFCIAAAQCDNYEIKSTLYQLDNGHQSLLETTL